MFPNITAKRKEGEWEPNIAAQKRMQGFLQAFNLQILGEYHSHPEDTAELSDEDEQYIKDSWKVLSKISEEKIIDENNLTLGWLEILIRVKKENYRKIREIGNNWWTPAESNKLRGKITTNKNEGFDITLGAFVYMPEKEEFFEVPIYSEICSSFER